MDYKTLNKKSKAELITMVLQMYNKLQALVSSADVHEQYILKHFDSDSEQEQFYVMYLNTKCEILGHDLLFIGARHKLDVDVKVVIKNVVQKKHCKAIIIAHNHPSNDLRLSPEDIDMTKKIAVACAYVDVSLLDSIVFTPNKEWTGCSKNIRNYLEEGLWERKE